MFNLFDMMRQAQGGAGFDNLARQFGLAPAQGQAAVAALLPALMMGLQRTAMNPAAMEELMGLLARAPYGTYFQSAAQAFSPQARREGDQVLLRLFGSPEMGQAVARQAAAFSGLTPALMWQMFPIVAATFMGGLLVGRLLAGVEQDLLSRAPGSPPSGTLPAPGTSGLGFPWAWPDLMAAMLDPARPPAAARPSPLPSPAPHRPSESARPPAPEPPSAPAMPDPLKAWSAWMNAGREMQAQYLSTLQSLLDMASGPRSGRR